MANTKDINQMLCGKRLLVDVACSRTEILSFSVCDYFFR